MGGELDLILQPYVESIANNLFDKFEQIDRETFSKEAKLIAYVLARHSSLKFKNCPKPNLSVLYGSVISVLVLLVLVINF